MGILCIEGFSVKTYLSHTHDSSCTAACRNAHHMGAHPEKKQCICQGSGDIFAHFPTAFRWTRDDGTKIEPPELPNRLECPYHFNVQERFKAIR